MKTQPWTVSALLAAFGPTLLTSAHAQDELSLDDILNLKLTVASKTAKTARESPGVVTLITTEEIRDSGARDLIDVLRTVPGLDFGEDSYGSTGLSVRGVWAMEGKAQLSVDGIELNELAYQNVVFGNELPIEHISRIEIIRGPGSAVYGGTAQLAVINIITLSGRELAGLRASVRGGLRSDSNGLSRFNLAYGKKNDESLEYSLALSGSASDLSDGKFVGTSAWDDSEGPQEEQVTELKDYSDSRNLYANLGINYKNLRTRFLYQNQSFDSTIGYGVAIDVFDWSTTFNTYGASAEYDWKLSDQITLTPRVSYRFQQPWHVTDERLVGTDYYFTLNTQRTDASLSADIKLTEQLNLLLGASVYFDHINDTTGNYVGEGEDPIIRFNDQSLFAQLEGQSDLGSLTVGGRYEHHSAFGDALVPRFAYTKAFQDLHIKLLYSKAFRLPSATGYITNEEVTPEFATAMEFETGYQLTRESSLVLNAFRTTIDDVIVYTTLEDQSDYYFNGASTGSQGVELELRYRTSTHSWKLGYSLYSALDNTVEDYQVDTDESALQGFANHKVMLTGSIRLLDQNLILAPTYVLFGPRYGHTWTTPSTYEQKEFPVSHLLNVFVTYKNLGLNGLDVGAGVFNALNDDYAFIQPYGRTNQQISVKPGPSREFQARLTYSKSF